MAPGRDRISQLPTDILDHILGLLPIKNAAKTAVLSSIWRGAWSSLTQLNFDDDFFCHIDRKYHRVKKSNKEYAPSLYVINKVLLQHNGTIRKLILNFSNVGKLTYRYRSFDFDQWLLLVTKKGVEEMYIGVNEKAYKLPSCIFSCLTLKRLHMYGVIIGPVDLPRILPNVDSLCFEHVDFGPKNLLRRAVDVPVLENLSFLSCQNIFYFNLTAPKLCGLTIKCCSSNVPDKFLPVNLDLKSFLTLELEGSLQEFGKEFTKLGFQLNVEYLKLSCFSHKSDVRTSAFVNLLQLCPKLCKLEINLSQLEVVTMGCVDAWLEVLEKLHSAAQINKMLQTLKVTSFSGSKTQILFIRKLLASFSTLKKVIIVHMHYGLKEENRITKELLHFHGTSIKAEIIFV
ncbi:PREDICTED: F-box/FBD/LRR-repeat protein At1g13570-like [Ipomoea nil]|uniref:F-box/FBD/LRR-repeat protein At1g13570-like n=1 Tax=Ipomoea nil TaxID=35883 RepID=UPI0009008538|nr:PREDICTED: F-box/FBD/LRR-repeat protein At1g13570-like [Ipomoea nil]